jgi:hypothetical protein
MVIAHGMRNELSSSKEASLKIIDLASKQLSREMLIIESSPIQEKQSSQNGTRFVQGDKPRSYRNRNCDLQAKPVTNGKLGSGEEIKAKGGSKSGW